MFAGTSGNSGTNSAPPRTGPLTAGSTDCKSEKTSSSARPATLGANLPGSCRRSRQRSSHSATDRTSSGPKSPQPTAHPDRHASDCITCESHSARRLATPSGSKARNHLSSCTTHGHNRVR
eukprot:5019103-Alexandrium_andersonii.AAC.1